MFLYLCCFSYLVFFF